MFVKVKTPADLHKVALSKGARVTSPDGKVINASKKHAAPRPKAEPDKRLEPADQKPIPAPKAAPVDLTALVDKVGDIGKASVMMLAELKEEISNIQIHSEHPILDWDFRVIRDDKGYLTNIKAHAEIVKPTLN